MKKSGLKWFCGLAAVTFCGLLVFGGCSQSEEDDLFQYAVDTSQGALSPARADFGASLEEVLEQTGLSQEDVDVREEGPEKTVAAHTFELPGLSDSVIEMFTFSQDSLVSVDYLVAIPSGGLETACQTLREQAASTMPEELYRGVGTVVESISSRETTVWEDPQQNTVTLLFPANVYEDPLYISLMIDPGRGAF